MRKKLVCITSFLMALIAFVSCAPNNSDSNNDNTSTRKYITHFDNYEDCILLPASGWIGENLYVTEGKVTNEWNQEDTQYISEGIGSIKVRLLDGYSCYSGRIRANNYRTQVYNINGATKISLDVYNPESKPIDVTIDVESASGIMFSVSESCQPGQWTTVATDIESKTYDNVRNYKITLKNNVDGKPFTLYLDNFYVDFAK